MTGLFTVRTGLMFRFVMVMTRLARSGCPQVRKMLFGMPEILILKLYVLVKDSGATG